MSAVRHRGARGSTLVEVLGAMTWGSILIVALAAGAITMSRSSAETNKVARVNTTVNAFAELLRSDSIPYVPCATMPDDDYGAPLRAKGGSLRADTHILISVTGVDTGSGCSDTDSSDPGVQTITIEATWDDISQQSKVVKRDPNPQRLVAVLTVSPLSGDGDDVKEFALSATGSRGPDPIVDYVWDCGNGEPSITVHDPDDPSAHCIYTAQSAATSFVVELTVKDSNARQARASREVVVLPAATPRPKPPVDFTYSPASPVAGDVVSFTSTGGAPAEGSVVKWEWTFDDADSGSSNTATCTDPTCANATHRFTRGRTYNVTLRVTDNFGQTNTASKSVVVTAAPVPQPLASFTATPPNGISGQRVVFDASASRNGSGGTSGLTYSWTINGTANARTGVNPDFTYAATASTITDTVTLRVTETATGGWAETTRVVSLLPFVNANGFQLVDAHVPWVGKKTFTFKWQAIARSPGDQIRYRLRVENISGCLTFNEPDYRETTIDSNSPAGAWVTGTMTVPGSVCGSWLNPLTFDAWIAVRRLDDQNNVTWTADSARIRFVVR